MEGEYQVVPIAEFQSLVLAILEEMNVNWRYNYQKLRERTSEEEGQ